MLRTVPLTSIDGLEEWGSREEAEDSITLLTNLSELDPKDNNNLAAVVQARTDNYPELCDVVVVVVVVLVIAVL